MFVGVKASAVALIAMLSVACSGDRSEVAGSTSTQSVQVTEALPSSRATGPVGGAYVAIGDTYYLLICERIAAYGLEIDAESGVSTWSITGVDEAPRVFSVVGKDPAEYLAIELDPADCRLAERRSGKFEWYLGVRADGNGPLVPTDPNPGPPSADD